MIAFYAGSKLLGTFDSTVDVPRKAAEYQDVEDEAGDDALVVTVTRDGVGIYNTIDGWVEEQSERTTDAATATGMYDPEGT